MSLNDYKITQGDIASKGVQAAPDVLSGSPAENKAIFDRLISEAVAVQFNALIDKLVENGAEAILRRGDDSVLYLRLNADKVLEVSTDGKEYFSTVGSGHIIVDKYGKDMPEGLRLQFDNFEVREENGTIIVHGVAEEIAGAIPNTEKGAPNGVATLDAEGKVPTEQLPDPGALGAAAVETGTWTPVFGEGSVFTATDAVYTKVGKIVHASANIVMNNSDAPSVTFSGLPYTPAAVAIGHFIVASAAATFMGDHILIPITGECYLFKAANSYANRYVTPNEIGGTRFVRIHLVYESNS